MMRKWNGGKKYLCSVKLNGAERVKISIFPKWYSVNAVLSFFKEIVINTDSEHALHALVHFTWV